MSPQAEHLKPLTALRFLAAAWVVLFHWWSALNAPQTPALVARGYLGVEVFFVLSGFILCHVYLKAFGEGGFDYGGFLKARLARIYPLHLVTLIGVGALAIVATAAGASVDAAVLSWESLPANLLLLNAWGLAPEAGWNHPSWSISAEWFAYLAFPVFAWAAWALRRRPLTALALAAAGLVGTYAVFERLAGFPLTQATIHWGALRIVPCFALGCAAYLAWSAGAARSPGTAGFLAVAGLSALVLFAAGGGADALAVLASTALILGLAGLSQVRTPLRSRVAVWLGEVSFAVYMVCVPVKLVYVNGVQRLTGAEGALPVWLWIPGLALVLVVAAAAHHLVEKPARDRLRGLRLRSRRETLAPETRVSRVS